MGLNDIVLVRDLAIVLAAALAGGWLFRRLKQSSITGYLIAGIIIGPYVLGFVRSDNEIQVLAAIGVVLLFFILGVKFSLRDIADIGAVSTWGALFQITLSAAMGGAVVYFLGFSVVEAIAFGLIISMSSTILAIAMLTERGEMGSVHGRIIIGIMLMQDIASAFVMFVFPVLGGAQSHISALSLIVAMLEAAAFLAAVLLLGGRVVPGLLRRVIGHGSRELLIIASIALCFGAAFGAASVGLSAALGAFALGLLISGSDFSHQVLGDMSAMRDIFAAIFFVSVGTFIDLPAIADDAVAVVVIVAAVMAGKFIICSVTARMFGYRGRTVPLVGAGMLQIGEFSFVLAQLALGQGVISSRLYSLILAAALISIALTPSIYAGVNMLGLRMIQNNWSRWLVGGYGVTLRSRPSRLTNHVVICGYGQVGSNVAQLLAELKIPYLVVDLDPSVIRNLRHLKVPCVFGDAGNREVLLRTNPSQAAMIVVAMQDPTATRLILDHVREMGRELDVVIRVHSQSELEYLKGRGAAELVQPEIETSLEIVRHIICRLGYPDEQVMALIDSRRRTCPR